MELGRRHGHAQMWRPRRMPAARGDSHKVDRKVRSGGHDAGARVAAGDLLCVTPAEYHARVETSAVLGARRSLTDWAAQRSASAARQGESAARGGWATFKNESHCFKALFGVGPEKRSAKARSSRTIRSPVIGMPWPPANTCGSSLASTATDSFAASHPQVEYHGGPEILCFFSRRLHDRNPQSEFKSTVRRASPVIRARSRFRKNAT